MTSLNIPKFNSIISPEVITPKETEQEKTFFSSISSKIHALVCSIFSEIKHLFCSWSTCPKLSEYATTIFATHNLPEGFWKTPMGTSILRIYTLLQELQIVPDKTEQEIQAELESRIYAESTDTGESLAKLIALSGNKIDIEQSSISLALLQKISQIIFESKNDLSLRIKACKDETTRSYYDITGHQHRVIQEYLNSSDDAEGKLKLDELKKHQRSVIELASTTRKLYQALLQKEGECKKAYQAIEDLATASFMNSSVQYDELMVGRDSASNAEITTKLAGTNEPLAAHLVEVDRSGKSQRTISILIKNDEQLNAQLFVPRIGVSQFSSRQSLSESISSFLHECTSDKNTVRVTIWKIDPKRDESIEDVE